MSDINQPKRFGFPVAWLKGYVRRFQAALKDPVVGPQILAQLVRTFPTDLDTQVENLARASAAQLDARGAGHAFTRAQNQSLDDVMLLSFNARDAAKAVFTGQDALLHSEFMVGQHKPEDLDSIVHRAEIIVASCRNHAESLAVEGWSAEHTELLASALTALKSAEDNQQLAADDKEGCTARQIAEANRLYRMCRTIQRVARVVYSLKKAKTDPSVYAARAKFLLGEFPPRHGTTPPADPADEAAPAAHSDVTAGI